MPSITQLEYLIAVNRLRHFGKAAEACHVTQPTLSMQIQKLEEEFNIVLFDRRKQPIVPTPEAIAIIAQAQAVLREVKHLQELGRHNVNKLSGELKIASIPTLS